MPRTPSEWTAEDRALVVHALLRTRWQADLDDDHAFRLSEELAEAEGVPLVDLLEALPEPMPDRLEVGG